MINKDNIKIEYVDIHDLQFADYNPRKANGKEFDLLKENIQKFGLVDPIIVNSAENRKNIIIGGHFRVRVALSLGYEKVPVVYVNIPDIDVEKELNIKLNKHSGHWDFDLLSAHFSNEDLVEWGFDEIELGIDNSKGEIETDDYNKNLENYLDNSIRQLVLFYEGEKYGEMIGRFDEALKQNPTLKNYSELVEFLINHYENTGN